MTAPIAAARRIVEAGLPIGPRLEPCSCSHDRHRHSGARFTGRCAECGCARYRPDMAYQLAVNASAGSGRPVLAEIEAWHSRMYPRPTPDDGGWGVGPSDTGTCRRRIWYREKHPELGTDPVDESAAILGDVFHEIVRRARSFLYPTSLTGRMYEVAVRVPGLDRTGRVDDYDPVMAVVDDLKSVGERSWDALRDGPRLSHQEQDAVYGLGLIHAGHPVKYLRITYLRRATGEDEQFTWDFDPAFARRALGKLLAINMALDLDEVLPRDGRGPSTDVICRKYCPFVSACWNVEEASEHKVSPEHLTILGRHPEEAEIANAAAIVRGWKDEENQAGNEYDAAKSLLAGVPDGEYGEYEIRKRTRLVRDDKRHVALIEETIGEYLSYPAGIRGDLVDWLRCITPPTRTETWIEVKRVRAAKRQKAVA